MTTSKDGSSPRCCCWGSLLALLSFCWGTSTAVSLVEQEFDKLPFTTPGSPIAEGASNNTNKISYGESTTRHDCGTGCEHYCDFCHGLDRMHCLSLLIEHMCYAPFRNKMDEHNSSDWCVWSNVRSVYNNFTICTEDIAECLLIPWPNPMVESIFLQIHATYFHACPTEELSDPPPPVVLALVMTPICLIPVMVVLVVLKSKNGDGSS